ncbi:hypothetical protein PP640_gp68 [Arthrobacter phage Faja]|uniref:Uncharacterized protein n=1 Tax=Arthrobacter phage Faja TaxID=2419957 RepID=A0A3G2KG10_9CAUD|nr:hypothetical protein PP640_gp68 [Arthrobacter phage Faja]AYN57919.1 hypothetical protein PBI_FAJA_68 [Arthrobacter phage Faja]
MCNLMEHSERSSRELEARKREPVYASLADERGVPYEGPEQGPFSCPEKGTK